MATVRKKAYAILGGTVLPIDRIAADRPFYSGRRSTTGRTCRSSPTQPVASSGPRTRFPEPRTT